MRMWIVRAGLILLLPLAAGAQEIPKAEVYGGYSFVRNFKVNHHGWNASVAGVINRNLAIVADASGQYAKDEGLFFGFPFSSDIKVHSFLLGPRVSETVGGRWTPFAHVLVGVARVTQFTDTTVSGTVVSDDFRKVGFATAIGGGLDFWITPRVAVRLGQAEYYLVRLGDAKNETPRLGVGLVWRLGSKQQ